MAQLTGKDELIARIEITLTLAKRIREESRNNVQQLAQLRDLLCDENPDTLNQLKTPTAERHKENNGTEKKDSK